ncbi:hypothetical protein D1BOALGB6SA_2096 [Olavius sp. associated proteobacterium Delta 1]|nr:hypothetical protein D1BOALGB6SA_2096 [Olavius sp. associated proteobacterium Delta 1]
MSALVEFGSGTDGLTAEDFGKPGQFIKLGVQPVRPDIITSIAGRIKFQILISD